ncbi:DNA-binding MarR family transcriptional regulator [Kibdelosporangium banguiense]|uniref:DNA-binding MarR family transcriptional regulator n=1 Tax=Kibdelosporangium banguiense TaxID=1365924 RepID=A0ABS4TNB4_9PSEU|nr:MarR family transcriptional regulator [Kibdelosporangium banguiense]MBP2325903.1 DNA-binding MarR family transcriptional regulator [Kibdelosporangium banguiense]
MSTPEPRWLSHQELAAWLNLTRLLLRLPTALDRQLRDEAGLPHAYYQVLAILSGQPGRAMRMAELARHTGTTPSRLSHAVATLEQRGWIERQACATDKRGQIALLTDAGFAVLEAAAPGHVAEVRRLVFDHLTPDDVAQLGAITAKLITDPLPGMLASESETEGTAAAHCDLEGEQAEPLARQGGA